MSSNSKFPLSALLDSGRAAVRRLGYGGILALMLALMTRPVRAADQILLLDVQLNGRSINKVGEFTLRDGELMARCSELRELGLRVPLATKSRGGIPCPDTESDGLAALTDLRGLTWHLDQKTQTLYLTAADALLLPTLLQVDQRSIIYRRIESGTGMTLNYDIVNTFASSRNSTSGVLDLRTFSPLGVASSGLLVYAGGGATGSTRKKTIRLDSVYTFGDAVALRRYSIGDFITDSLVWTRPVRLTGAQIRSDFSMRPDLITFPLPSIRGSTAVPSTVDVLANGSYISSQQVDPGPFQIPQLPVVSGAGTISLRVTNALGQQVMVTQPFYASSALLKPGLQTYSAEAGAVRRNWGAVSNDYGKLAGTATYRRGLTSTLTVEGSAEGTPGTVKAGAGGVVQVGNWGVLNFAAAGSTGSGLSLGAQYSLSAQRISRKFSLGGSATLADRNFRDVAAANGDPVPRRELSANFGLALGLFGSIGIAYAGLDRDAASGPIQIAIMPAQHSRVFSASYSVQVHHMSYTPRSFKTSPVEVAGGFNSE